MPLVMLAPWDQPFSATFYFFAISFVFVVSVFYWLILEKGQNKSVVRNSEDAQNARSTENKNIKLQR